MGKMFFKKVEDILASNNMEIVEADYKRKYSAHLVDYTICHSFGDKSVSFCVSCDDTRKGFYHGFMEVMKYNLPWKNFVENISKLNSLGFGRELMSEIQSLITYSALFEHNLASVAIQLEILYGEKGALNNEE